MFQHMCRNSSHHYIVFHISYHQCLCTNSNIVSNMYSSNNFRATTNFHIIPDNRSFVFIISNCYLLKDFSITANLFGLYNSCETMLD